MIKANVFEVKSRLSEYLDRAAHGERIVIYRHSTPVAELRAVEAVRTEPRPIGPLPEESPFEVPASFFEPLPDEELELWEGGLPADSLPWTSTPQRRRRTSKVAEEKGGYRAPARRVRRRRRS